MSKIFFDRDGVINLQAEVSFEQRLTTRLGTGETIRALCCIRSVLEKSARDSLVAVGRRHTSWALDLLRIGRML